MDRPDDIAAIAATDTLLGLAKALAPFARVAAINAPLSANWPDSKPNPEFLPTAWPDWGDFKRALETLDAVLPNWREENDHEPKD